MQKPINYSLLLLLVFLLLPSINFGHTINYILEGAPTNNVVWYYLKLGYQHILPLGLDHILFVVGLCMLNANIKTLFWQASAFTVAHTITLILSMKNIITAPPAIVEPIIALSIVFIAIENIVFNKLNPLRIVIIFLFGLIHGLGFASALNEMGLPRDAFYTSLLSFNIGVELGQFTIILLVYWLLIKWFQQKEYYRKFITIPISLVISAIALYWAVERII
ncbi:MAG: HupE/UreJ family protein [Bacteroidia bacterium]|nr:HupE/UreJ family protein [Bacteroidia bacterium]